MKEDCVLPPECKEGVFTMMIADNIEKWRNLKWWVFSKYERKTFNTFGAVRAYSKKYGHACGITKKGQESPVKGHSFGFAPLIFANLGHLECYTPLNGMYFWRF